MGELSAIEWTHSTWNPWRGCTKVDPTCAACYMFRDQLRYGRDPSVVVRCAPGTFHAPLSAKWQCMRAECIERYGQHLVFTCSWSDWFHEDADPWRAEAWDIIRRTPGSTYQILTSRPDRILDCLPADWGDGWPNVWMGVTIGNRQFIDRADLLRQVPAVVRFISAEPLLGPLVYPTAYMEPGTGAWVPCWEDTPVVGTGGMPPDNRTVHPTPELDLAGIDWLIVGGESGGRLGRSPDRAGWVRDLRDRCVGEGVAFLFKQWGGPRPNSGGRLLDGRTWDELPTPVSMSADPPADLLIREFPA